MAQRRKVRVRVHHPKESGVHADEGSRVVLVYDRTDSGDDFDDDDDDDVVEADEESPVFLVYDRTGDEFDSDHRDPVVRVGKFVNRVAHSEQSFIDSYIRRHNESNERRDGGWLWDFEENVYRALRTGSRRLKLRRLVGL